MPQQMMSCRSCPQCGRASWKCAVCRYSVAIMLDTEGSEVHTSELKQPVKAEVRVC